MISYKEAMKLLKKYNLKEKRIDHSKGVSRVAYWLAKKIKKKNPHCEIDPELIKIAGLLHDIGRGIEKGNHVKNSIEILKREGYKDLADSVIHGTAYESFKMKGIDDPSLLPSNLNSKIVAYADTRYRLKLVSYEERINELKERRGGDAAKMKAVTLSIQRYNALQDELSKLAGIKPEDVSDEEFS